MTQRPTNERVQRGIDVALHIETKLVTNGHEQEKIRSMVEGFKRSPHCDDLSADPTETEIALAFLAYRMDCLMQPTTE